MLLKVDVSLHFCRLWPAGGPRTRIRADPRGPKLKIRGHSAARIPADIVLWSNKQYLMTPMFMFWLLNTSQNEKQKSFYSENTVVHYLKNSICRDSTAKSPPPKEGRFGPKFPDLRALLMRGDFFSYRARPSGARNRPSRPSHEGGLRALPLGGLCSSFYNSVLRQTAHSQHVKTLPCPFTLLSPPPLELKKKFSDGSQSVWVPVDHFRAGFEN